MPKPRTGPASPAEGSFENVDQVRQHDIRLRLARVEGHLKALGRQMQQGGRCDDLIIQAAAVRSAMSAIMSKLVEAHIDSCVKVCARRGKGDRALEDLKQAFTTALRQV